MNNTFTYLGLFAFLFTSCNNQSTINSKALLSDKMNEPFTCYSYTKDSNNIMMHIAIEDNIVKGDLIIEYYQKDKNIGQINGEMKGDTLYAEFTFMSEGVNSVREVAFLKKEGELIEGFGEVEEQSGKVVFKNKATLKFDNKIHLTVVRCDTTK